MRQQKQHGSRWCRSLSAGLFSILLWGTAPPSALADLWYVHYENAERALAAESWREAVEEIQQALERKGDSGVRVRSYGMKFVDYFPYLKLGIAYYHLGQEAAALEAFDTEERLGLVQESATSWNELQTYRNRVAEKGQKEEQEEARLRQESIDRGLEAARALAADGRLEEAMTALAPALAADPEHPEATALMARLGERTTAAEEETRLRAENAERLERARALQTSGEAQAAAPLLREVLASGENREAQTLLDRATAQIVATVAAEQKEREIEEAMSGARQSWAAGDGAAALELLEVALALDPDHTGAQTLRVEITKTQTEDRRRSRLQDILDQASELLAEERYEEALSAANRALALERGQPRALDLVRRSYQEISRRLLGASAVENLPPAIRFADLRQELDGKPVEVVARSDFRLTGVVIDNTPVSVALADGIGSTLEATASSQSVGELVITEFSVRHRLSPGETTLVAVATDGQGLSSRGEYAVIYHRPWFLSPWLWVVAAVAPGLVLAGWGLRRHQERRQQLRRRFNPYVAGGPIFDHKLFYGREPLVQKILQTVHNNSLLLFGERRIGKTSLLHQVHHRLERLDDPDFAFFPVYIDLQGTPEEAFFATLADQIFEAAEGWVGPVDRALALGREGGYDHHQLIRELRTLLRRLAEGTPKQVKLVMLIDEVDELNHYDPRVNQGLRSLFMKRFAENLAAVVAGVGIRKAWEKEGSPWYNFFEEIEVDALADDAARRLVREPMAGMFQISEGAAKRIVERSEGKPFLIQRACLALVQRLHEEGRRTVTPADVDSVLGHQSPDPEARPA